MYPIINISFFLPHIKTLSFHISLPNVLNFLTNRLLNYVKAHPRKPLLTLALRYSIYICSPLLHTAHFRHILFYFQIKKLSSVS
jgi:hypothetical protein